MIQDLEKPIGHFGSPRSGEPQSAQLVRPLVTGDQSPFADQIELVDVWQLPGFVDGEPLVVSFYCPCWGRYARPYLLQLIELADQLRAQGLNLLVFSNEPVKTLLRQFPKLNFHVVYDVGFTVASQFGVYSEAFPIWDRVSGISEEVFTPALYVISPDQQIRYHFLDEDFDKSLPADAVVDAALQLKQA
ncbi:peroxiredoxin [Telluribacter sp. SYSU D00476]|uniref:peroxiredoxin family protein n=1 Tax=Telluribacter sp. SYSU D00476 TaxID=2811430 RepID=UPI001FF1F5FB|nr:redoxin domain-containing protein [Telluribacter sp. SYSU D00476]